MPALLDRAASGRVRIAHLWPGLEIGRIPAPLSCLSARGQNARVLDRRTATGGGEVSNRASGRNRKAPGVPGQARRQRPEESGRSLHRLSHRGKT